MISRVAVFNILTKGAKNEEAASLLHAKTIKSKATAVAFAREYGLSAEEIQEAIDLGTKQAHKGETT